MRLGQETPTPTKQPAPAPTPPPPPTPTQPSTEALLKNEMKIQLMLDSLHIDLYSALKRALNYALGKRSLAYKKWDNIGKDIKNLPLVPQARLRLKEQHRLFEKWVTPKPFSLLKALAPFFILWLAKGLWSRKSQERGIDKFLKKKRNRQRLKQKQEKEQRRREKASTALEED